MLNNLDLANIVFEPIFGYKPFRKPATLRWDFQAEEQAAKKANFAQSNMPAVRQVIFNKNATIVYFTDGSKCIVRKSVLDEYNREHALVYAIVKRAYGIIDPDTGVVNGNGMGNMLAKLVANGLDQEKLEEEKKLRKIGKIVDKKDVPKKQETVDPWPVPPAKVPMAKEECEECETCEEEDCCYRVAPYKKPVRQQKREEAKSPVRDSKGRFAKKANRK